LNLKTRTVTPHAFLPWQRTVRHRPGRVMSHWLTDAYAVTALILLAVILILLVRAGYLALWAPDTERQKQGLRVLRLLIYTGAAGSLMLKLHQLGLL